MLNVTDCYFVFQVKTTTWRGETKWLLIVNKASGSCVAADYGHSDCRVKWELLIKGQWIFVL